MSYLGAKNAVRVPSGYTQLEYIQSTGTQRIDWGISVPHASEKTVIEFAPMDVGYDNAIAGHAAPEWSWATNVSMVLNSNILVGNTTVPSVSLDVFCKFEYTKTYAKINDGTAVTLQNLTYTDGYNNTLFYASTKYGKHKVKAYKLYNGSAIVRDAVPCKDPYGAIGMYDAANNVFYGNAGTGVFIAGPEIPSGFVARVTPKWYFGDSNNIARNIVAGYIGDANNLARLFYSSSNLFGDGSDGDAVIASAMTLRADTEDTGMIVKNYKSLTITSAGSLTAGNRNCGMIIRVKGDCTIDGSIVNMMAPKTILDSDGVDFSIYPATMKTTLAGAGGNGGGRDSNGKYNGERGWGMSGRFYGGGYSGGAKGGYLGDSAGPGGGDATGITTAIASIFVGGAQGSQGTYGGGGGGQKSRTGSSYYGGAGGSGPGGNGGAPNYGSAGGGAGNYGGGVVILLVGGNLTINSTGKINCNGGKGGNSGVYGSGFKSFGGGGGGGGRIFICHKGTISNKGSLTVNGGSIGTTSGMTGVAGETEGTAGGIGTIAIKTYDQYKEEDVE